MEKVIEFKSLIFQAWKSHGISYILEGFGKVSLMEN